MPEAGGPRVRHVAERHTAPALGWHCLNTFSHPDYTVGPGISPDRALVLPLALAGFTAGQDLDAITRHHHQSPKALLKLTIHQ